MLCSFFAQGLLQALVSHLAEAVAVPFEYPDESQRLALATGVLGCLPGTLCGQASSILLPIADPCAGGLPEPGGQRRKAKDTEGQILVLVHYHYTKIRRMSETPTTTTSQKSIAVRLQFVLQYASNLYCFDAPTL